MLFSSVSYSFFLALSKAEWPLPQNLTVFPCVSSVCHLHFRELLDLKQLLQKYCLVHQFQSFLVQNQFLYSCCLVHQFQSFLLLKPVLRNCCLVHQFQSFLVLNLLDLKQLLQKYCLVHQFQSFFCSESVSL